MAAARNTSRSMMMIAIEDSFEDDIFVDDSLSWEVIEPSDDDSDNFSYDSDDLEEKMISEEEEVVSSVVGSPDSDVSMESLVEQIDLNRVFEVQPEVVVDEIDGGDYYYDDEVDEDDDEDEEEDYLDDELVPKWVNNRFERQRMRKLGKRAFNKMKNSKKQPFLYNRPGCVHGKHGLGLKHSLI